MFGRRPSEDELYTAEAYYSAVESLGHDAKLLRLYVNRLLVSNDHSPVGFAESDGMGSSLENAAER
jgi:hypothetical protein